MKLLSLEISNYKSIIKPIKINFEDNFITILGKNGSGKSTIIDAIHEFFCVIHDGYEPFACYEGMFKARIQVSGQDVPYLYLEDEDVIDVIIDFASQSSFDVYYQNELICSFENHENTYPPFVEALDKEVNLLHHETCFDYEQFTSYVDSFFRSTLFDYQSTHCYEHIDELSEEQILEVCALAEDLLYESGIFSDYPRSSIQFIYEEPMAFLYLKERNGDKNSIFEANTGRKWLLLYFIKKTKLSKNEILLIDEPAAFLHPEAQINILKDMENLVSSSNNNKVIYSTHSPYMISEKYDYFYYATKLYSGVKLSRHNIKDLHVARDEMRLIDLNNILLHIDKTYILVEGNSDVACFNKFMEIFNVDKTLYEVLQIDGSGNMKRISHFFKKNKLSYCRILDADQKEKYPNDKDIIYVGEDCDEKRIEGLFSLTDRQRYFKGEKVNAEKISKGNKFSKETLKNFKALFIKVGIIK